MPEHRRLITSRTGLRSAALVAALIMAGCGGEAPWNEAERDNPPPAATTPAAEPGPAAGDEDDAPEPAPAPTSTTPAPDPAGGDADDGGKQPDGPPNPVALRHDRKALGVMRTMVSAVEGCRSGRERYADCDAEDELGASGLRGAKIGDGVNEAQITAGTDGFRMTVRSRSGAKFTVARGPSGERLKCVAGPDRGVCGPDRRWYWTDAGA